jgi:hypothetical protein
MAARTQTNRWLAHALIAVITALVAAPTFLERLWTEVAPYVFQAPGNGEPLVFSTAGAVPVMQSWIATYERIGWTRQAPVHMAFVATCLLVFTTCAVRFAVTWRRWREARTARTFGIAAALANLTFVVWCLASIGGLGDTTPLPALDVALLTLGVIAAASAALLPGFALFAWREGWWTRGSRPAFTLLTVSAVAFAAWRDYWKLLGFRY